jgi:hypothetical protein
VQRSGPDPPGDRARTFDISLATIASSVAVAREQLRDWLAWHAEPTEDIVLAVSEAVTNAVEHARPTPVGSVTDAVEVRAVVMHEESAAGARRRIDVQVRYHGRWRLRPSREHSDGPNRFRGHGLAVMNASTVGKEVATPTPCC